jgi:hypothetical protein
VARGLTIQTVSFIKLKIRQCINFIIFLVEDKKIKSLDHILETRKKVKAEIAQLKEKLQQTREKITEYKENAAINTQQQ